MSGAVPQIEVGRRDDALVQVRLLRLPVQVHARAAEHTDELRREFALLRLQQEDDSTPDVPARLLALMDDLEERFSGYTEATELELLAAVERGEESLDVVFTVPAAARAAADDLEAMLEEADEYCRQGDALLTLETPPDAIAYRRWYLEEFRRQIDGGDPVPWGSG